jgi:hypothetical protein
MNCFLCHVEEIQTPATGQCAVCNDPTCRRPSLREDGRVHGENCRASPCDAFLCKLHVHQHLGVTTPVAAAKSVPTCFPYLTVDAAFQTWVAAEASFADRADDSLSPGANRAFTQAASLLDRPEWENSAWSLDAIATEWVREGGEARAPTQVSSSYFDPARIARLCLRTAAAFTLAWQQFRDGEAPRARPMNERSGRDVSAEAMDHRLARFRQWAVDEDNPASVERFSILSPRLAAFLTEVVAEYPDERLWRFEDSDSQLLERVTPIRQHYHAFRPSDESRKFGTVLDGWALV